MAVKNPKSDSSSSDESLPQPTKQPSSTQTQTRPPSSRLRSGVLRPSTPSKPVHIDLTEERRSKKEEDPTDTDHSRRKGKEKDGSSSAHSSDDHFMNKEDEEAFLIKFANRTGQGFIYLKLVKAFYIAAKVETSEDGSPLIKGRLKGVEIKFNLTILCLVTNLKDHGSRLYDEVNWLEKINASEEDVGRLIFSNGRISIEIEPNPSEDHFSESSSSGSESPRQRQRCQIQSPEPEPAASEDPRPPPPRESLLLRRTERCTQPSSSTFVAPQIQPPPAGSPPPLVEQHHRWERVVAPSAAQIYHHTRTPPEPSPRRENRGGQIGHCHATVGERRDGRPSRVLPLARVTSPAAAASPQL
ncbi:hypothetical protein SESBI_06155 [Sesbania bispinosa]|nr:hypothetical protein SESBI_06155 [Sesbania bispinosa]